MIMLSNGFSIMVWGGLTGTRFGMLRQIFRVLANEQLSQGRDW